VGTPHTGEGKEGDSARITSSMTGLMWRPGIPGVVQASLREGEVKS